MSTLTSREFNQDVSRAKRAANDGPVFITDRGRPAHVLMTMEAYDKLASDGPSIVDLIGRSPAAYVNFEPDRMSDDWGFKTVDFG